MVCVHLTWSEVLIYRSLNVANDTIKMRTPQKRIEMKKKKPNEDNYYYYEKNVKNKIADDEDIEQISCCLSFFL